MGQRHQAYLIARVRAHNATKATYRCIAAWHHQWCYGILPPQAVIRFYELIKQDDNAEIIREELRNIDGKYGAHTRKRPIIPAAPCPFALYLLATAFNVDLDGAHSRKDVHISGYDFFNSVLEAWIYPSQGDNNDGITVIDVTDPRNPSYCHAYLRGRPLNAWQYSRSYQEEDDDLLDALKGAKLIPLTHLAEAWPGEFKLPKDAAPVSEEEESQVNPAGLPSLTDLAFKPAVDQVINNGDIAALEQFIWIPEKASSILAILRGQEGPLTSTAMVLLTKLVEAHPSRIDLSELPLSSDGVLQALSGLKREQIIDYLNFSRIPALTLDTLRCVLRAHPNVKRLVLFSTSIANSEMDTIVHEDPSLFHNVEQLIHPAFVSSLGARKTYHSAFSFYTPPGMIASNNSISLPLLHPNKILQSLDDFLGAWVKLHRTPFSDPSTCQIATLAAFDGAPRPPGKRWGERSVCGIPLPSSDYLNEGWIFTVSLPEFAPTPPYYGFLRPKKLQNGEEGCKYQIHDFESFIQALKEEGYPSPPEELVQKVQGHIAELKRITSGAESSTENAPPTLNTASPQNILATLVSGLASGQSGPLQMGGGGQIGLSLITEDQLPDARSSMSPSIAFFSRRRADIAFVPGEGTDSG